MKHILIYAFAVFLLTACGGEEEGAPAEQAAKPAPEKAMQPSEKPAMGAGEEEMMVVDHSRDEIEFELRRSLNGVERLIEHYKEEGFDTAELEAKKEKLQKELEEFLSQ